MHTSIKTNNLIPLNLIQIFPQESIFGIEVSGSYHSTVKGLMINNVIVEVDEKSNNALYRAANLNGLALQSE